MASNVFTFQQCILTFDSSQIIGFADSEDCIKLALEEERVTTQVGADGAAGTFSVSAKRSAKLTVSLLGSSPSNDLFAAYYQALDSGLPVPALVYLKGENNLFFASGEFLVAGFPEIKLGKEIGTRDWEFKTTQVTIFPGNISKSVSPNPAGPQ